MEQIVSQATRVTKDSVSLLNIILTNVATSVIRHHVSEIKLSDHDLVSCLLNYCLPKSVQVWMFKKF